MIDLLKRELPSHYKLHRTIVDVPYEITAEEHFDLTDRGLTSIVDYKTGNISFDHSNRTEVQVINYVRGEKRCVSKFGRSENI